MSDDERFGDNDSDADKRAYHNLLERKRRDHIKDSFTSLRETLPAFRGGNVRASRAQILMKAADYIETTRRRNDAHLADIDDLKKQNKILEDMIQTLQKAKKSGDYSAALPILESHHLYTSKASTLATYETDSGSDLDDSTDSEPEESRRKRFKALTKK